ncbi:MAG: hypothetical protein COB12_06800 [Flavobacterium sp.]|nr:MAG: hypothetical protein COB12_06800 [Flavobacterium sp.]
MNYKQTTQIPNVVFDKHLNNLSFSELKILLYILRQTYGWISKNGKRKKRDRITHGQFETKTGLSRRIISSTIQSLIIKQLITVSDYKGTLLHYPSERKGKVGIYYAPNLQTYADNDIKVGKKKHQPMQNRVYNKTNRTKLKRQKELSNNKRKSDWQRMQEILQSRI